MIITGNYALLPDRDVMPAARPRHSMAGVDRRIVGATKAPELGMMAEDWDRTQRGNVDGFVDLKVDGHRALFLGDIPRVVSREGELLTAADPMLDSLMALQSLYREPMVFDAEFASPGGLEATQSVVQRGAWDGLCSLWLFDAVPLEVWRSGNAYTVGVYERRIRLLSNAQHVKRLGWGVLRPIPTLTVEHVQSAAEQVWREGGEGVVWKRLDSPYERRRSSDWRKLKQSDEITVRIDGVTPQGTLWCTRDAHPGVGFGVGIGLTTERKAQFLALGDALKGRDVVIACQGFTAKGTPRHARFVRLAGEAA